MNNRVLPPFFLGVRASLASGVARVTRSIDSCSIRWVRDLGGVSRARMGAVYHIPVASGHLGWDLLADIAGPNGMILPKPCQRGSL